MYSYLAYGLRIHSELKIPELIPLADDDEPKDVTIHVHPAQYIDEAEKGDTPCVRADQSVARFAWNQIAAIEICGGRTIDVWPHPDLDREVLRLPLLGVAFGALLHQREKLVLHASSVLVEGGAVAFVGNKGFGKSTLAAAFHRIGHSILGDDVAAIDLTAANGPILYPAYPSLNIWPHAARALGDEPDDLPRLRAGGTKRSMSVRDGFDPEPVPLRAVYLLEYAPELRVEDVSGREAFTRLLPHCYAARYFSDMEGAAHVLLNACSELVRKVPVRRLQRKDAVADVLAAARQVISIELSESTATAHHAAA